MAGHIKVLGILHIVWSLWSLVMGGVTLTLLALLAVLSLTVSEDVWLFLFSAALMAVVGGYYFFAIIPGLVGGIGLLAGRSWSRIFLMAASVPAAFRYPVGIGFGGLHLHRFARQGRPSRAGEVVSA